MKNKKIAIVLIVAGLFFGIAVPHSRADGAMVLRVASFSSIIFSNISGKNYTGTLSTHGPSTGILPGQAMYLDANNLRISPNSNNDINITISASGSGGSNCPVGEIYKVGPVSGAFSASLNWRANFNAPVVPGTYTCRFDIVNMSHIGGWNTPTYNFDTLKYTFTVPNTPINGSCSAATNLTTKPAESVWICDQYCGNDVYDVNPPQGHWTTGDKLCNSLENASAIAGSGPWTWSCPGSNGGSAANCSTQNTDNGCAAKTCTTATCNNGTATVPGTKTDGACCVDNTWTPSAASVCPSQTVTQLSNCGRTRVVPGTSSPAFSPDPSKCYNVSYPQTNGCSWQLAVGTSKAETCCGSGADQTPGSFWNQWSPSSNMACSSVTVAQTATCNNIPGLTKSQTVSGGTFPTPGACGSANNQATNTLPNPSALCDLGSATPSPLTGLGPWSWSCDGLCGGASTSCQTLSPMTISGWKEVAP